MVTRDGRTRLDIRLASNELEVCHRRRGNRPRECETVEIVTDTGEEALTVAEKRGHEADLHLVERSWPPISTKRHRTTPPGYIQVLT